MFVCVCHAVTKAEIEKAVDEGAETREQVTKKCRAGGDCGACHDEIEQIIEDRAVVRRCHRAA